MCNDFGFPIDLTTFPGTRYQGSKRKLLDFLHDRLIGLKFNTALDLFSGSATVALLLRSIGKQVDANDYLPFNQNTAQLFLTVRSRELPTRREVEQELEALLHGPLTMPALVSDGFANIYFTNEENDQIDRFCQNVESVSSIRRSLYIYAVGQALLMKRPYNLFHRKNLNMRFATVERTFGNDKTWDTPIMELAIRIINELRHVTWLEPSGSAYCVNTSDGLAELSDQYDLVYIDPPYISEKSATNYADFYHFLTGLVDYLAFSRADHSKNHAPIIKLASNWTKQQTATMEIEQYIIKWSKAIIAFSYRDDGVPTTGQLRELLSSNGRQCEMHSFSFQYALSASKSKEVLFISLPSSSLSK